MSLFRYEAVDRTGKVVLGAMNAADEQQVAQRLAAMGYALKAVHPAGDAQRAAARPAVPTRQVGFPVSVESVVPPGSLARFYRQLATLVRAGMAVGQALDELTRTARHRKLRRVCQEMLQRVRSGEKLSGAMAGYPRVFPVHATGLIWGGELGGYLDIALDEAATEIEQEARDRRYASIGWFVAKISLFLVILSVPAFDLKGLLIRGLGEAAKLAGNPNPQPGAGDFIPAGITQDQILRGMAAGYWSAFKEVCVPLFIAWIVVALIWHRLKRVPSVRSLLDACLLWVPVWGRLHRERAIERFLKSLYQLYKSGVAPAQAWSAASTSVRNSEIARRLRSLDRELRRPGGTLVQAFAQSGVFPEEDLGMIASGERAGSVPEMLERLSSYHADAASSAKTKGRMLSFEALVLPIIIATGYLLIRMVQGYFNFVFNAPKLLGLE